MRELRDRTGRMPYRLWYEADEIDSIMQDEFEGAGSPVLGGLAVDVDAFIENHIGIVPDFVELEQGVQGATEFFTDGRVRMKIAADLAARAQHEKAAERLLRTTLAHEAAHVLLHRILFLRESESLFGGASSRQELCRDVRDVGIAYTGEWWEWQANRGMGALLLPRAGVVEEVRRLREEFGALQFDRVVDDVARAFAVSKVAARYRLEQLGAADKPGQKVITF